MILVLAVAVMLLAFLLAATLLGVHRFLATLDLRPRGLEQYAADHDVAYIPVSRGMIDGLREWSKPCQIKLDNNRHPLLLDLIVRQVKSDV